MLLIKTLLNYDSVPDVVCALYVTELSMIYHRDHAIVAREKSTLHHHPTTHQPTDLAGLLAYNKHYTRYLYSLDTYSLYTGITTPEPLNKRT